MNLDICIITKYFKVFKIIQKYFQLDNFNLKKTKIII